MHFPIRSVNPAHACGPTECWFAFGFLILFSRLSHGQLTENPFDSVDIQTSLDPSTRILAKSPDLIFEATIQEQDQEVEFDLGVVKANINYAIEIRATNRLGASVRFEDISTSCGCLSGFPKDVTLDAEAMIPIRVAFKVPPTEEPFGKVVSLVDPTNQVRLRIVFKGIAKHAVRLSRTIFPVVREGNATFEADIDYPFQDLNPDDLVFRFVSDSVSGWRVQHQEKRLVVDVFSSSEDTSETVLLLVTHRKNTGKVAEIPIEIRRGFHPTARPSTVLLKYTDESLKGRVLLQFQGLTMPGETRRCELNGFAKKKRESLEPSQFEFRVQAKLTGGSELITVAELMVIDPRIVEAPSDYALSVEFSSSIAGVSPFVVPMTPFGEEKP